MREIVFRVLSDNAGHIEAIATDPGGPEPLRITAPCLEELHHEAREALIDRLGPAHAGYRVRIRRSAPQSAIRPLHRPGQPGLSPAGDWVNRPHLSSNADQPRL